jgi:hypothetical protein
MASAQQWASEARHGRAPAPAIGARGTLEGGSDEPRPGRSGRFLHAVKERIEALRWHGNDQHGLLV